MEGQQGTVPMAGALGGEGANDGGEPSSFLETIPEAYREKAYMKDIDSPEKLYQQFDNAQALIGKKTVGIPTTESSEEDWNSFYNQMGRPESHDKYEFETVERPEGIPEIETDDKWIKETFHKAGLTDKQAKDIKKAYDERYLGMMKESIDKQNESIASQDSEFEGMLDKHFGGQKEAAVSRVNEMIKGNVPEAFREEVQKMDNKNLMVFTALLDNIHKKYISEDSPGGGDMIPTKSPEDLRSDARNLMMSKEYRDNMHPNHGSVRKQVSEIYAKIGKIGQK